MKAQQPTEMEINSTLAMVDLLQRMERPLYTPEYMQRNMIQCTCGKWRTITPEMLFYTGVTRRNGQRIMAVEHLCPECATSYKGTAKLVCTRCDPPRVIARIAPGRDSKSGLEFVADRCYHATGCPACCQTKEELGQTIMVEQAAMLARQAKK